MAFIAMVMFIALFVFGRAYFGWDDPRHDIQIALASAFVLGIVCGFRIRD